MLAALDWYWSGLAGCNMFTRLSCTTTWNHQLPPYLCQVWLLYTNHLQQQHITILANNRVLTLGIWIHQSQPCKSTIFCVGLQVSGTLLCNVQSQSHMACWHGQPGLAWLCIILDMIHTLGASYLTKPRHHDTSCSSWGILSIFSTNGH